MILKSTINVRLIILLTYCASKYELSGTDSRVNASNKDNFFKCRYTYTTNDINVLFVIFIYFVIKVSHCHIYIYIYSCIYIFI